MSITTQPRHAAHPKQGNRGARPPRRGVKLPQKASIVSAFLHASAESHAGPSLPVAQLVEQIQAGLAVGELQELQANLGLPAEQLAGLLGISRATLHRLLGGPGPLSPSVSDRMIRVARLVGQAIEVFEDEDIAKQWLNSAQIGLGGAVPLDYAQTEVGAREVENLLGRIEFGVIA